MAVTRHPHPDINTDFELLDDGRVRVRDHDLGTEGIFDINGRWCEGALRSADNHMVRWVADMTTRSRAATD